jgi:toxin ParE1/3/4
MMARVQYTSLAQQDLFENAEFVSRDSQEAAERLIERIEKTCGLLAANPVMGEAYQARFGSCRLFSSGPYAIFFRYVEDGIQVLRIVRGERDFENL